jgi:two-component system response regulator YesN
VELGGQDIPADFDTDSTPDALVKILEKRRLQAGLEHLSWPDFCQTYISDLISQYDLVTTQKIFGHSSTLLVKQASAFIQQNYTRSFSLEELSKEIGVSKSYLSRIFKTDTGISLWDYLNRYRIQKAKELLLLTDKNITAIADDVGYEDVSYFGRVFREIAGCSPRVFRQHGHSLAAA